MSKRTELLTALAQQALDQYGNDLKVGGEPIYPQWARDLQDVLGEHGQLVAALKRARGYLYNGFEPDNQSKAYEDVCAALAAAEA